jgi:hypothetical protein
MAKVVIIIILDIIPWLTIMARGPVVHKHVTLSESINLTILETCTLNIIVVAKQKRSNELEL